MLKWSQASKLNPEVVVATLATLLALALPLPALAAIDIRFFWDGAEIKEIANPAPKDNWQWLITTIKYRLAPQVEEFFSAQDMPSWLRIDLVSKPLPNNYCGFVPQGITHQILLSTACLNTAALPHLFIHEFQHLIQNKIGLEESWLNEGLAELLAVRLTGEAPLKSWRVELESGEFSLIKNTATTHLFLTYLYAHFGRDQWLKKMILDPRQGLDSLERITQELNGVSYKSLDPALLNFNSLFQNFSASLALNTIWSAPNALFSIDGMSANINFKLNPQVYAAAPKFGVNMPTYTIAAFRFNLASEDDTCISWHNKNQSTLLVINHTEASLKIQRLTGDACIAIDTTSVILLTTFAAPTVEEILFFRK